MEFSQIFRVINSNPISLPGQPFETERVSIASQELVHLDLASAVESSSALDKVEHIHEDVVVPLTR